MTATEHPADPPDPSEEAAADGWRRAYAVCTPVDPAAREAAARNGRYVPDPGPTDVVRPCQGCNGRIWVPPALTCVTTGQLAGVCPACHRGHLASLGLLAALTEARNQIDGGRC